MWKNISTHETFDVATYLVLEIYYCIYSTDYSVAENSVEGKINIPDRRLECLLLRVTLTLGN